MTSIDFSHVLNELQLLRRIGLRRLGLPGHEFPALLAAAHAAQDATDGTDGAQIEMLLRTVVSDLEDPSRKAARHEFGLNPGQSDAPASARRAAAAGIYGISPERFRMALERQLLAELAEQVLKAARLRGEDPGVHEETPDCLAPGETRLAQGIASSLVSDGQAEEALKSVLARATSRVGSSGSEAD